MDELNAKGNRHPASRNQDDARHDYPAHRCGYHDVRPSFDDSLPAIIQEDARTAVLAIRGMRVIRRPKAVLVFD
jgi:hypothetical protein